MRTYQKTIEEIVCRICEFKTINDVNIAAAATYTKAYKMNEQKRRYLLKKKIIEQNFHHVMRAKSTDFAQIIHSVPLK